MGHEYCSYCCKTYDKSNLEVLLQHHIISLTDRGTSVMLFTILLSLCDWAAAILLHVDPSCKQIVCSPADCLAVMLSMCCCELINSLTQNKQTDKPDRSLLGVANFSQLLNGAPTPDSTPETAV